VVTCGATAGSEISFDLWPFFVKQQRLIGSYGRNRADMQATLQWAAEGKLKPVIDRFYPLEKAVEGLGYLRARQVLGKVLIKI
jgi:D-arabinose 1-dehydrogenase-like Zn-dependent alcohol dehydrogenase